jgi:hypothetical protein
MLAAIANPDAVCEIGAVNVAITSEKELNKIRGCKSRKIARNCGSVAVARRVISTYLLTRE